MRISERIVAAKFHYGLYRFPRAMKVLNDFLYAWGTRERDHESVAIVKVYR